MSIHKGYTYAEYVAAYERLGSFKAVARELGVNESTARRSIHKGNERDPAMQGAMDAVGTGLVPSMAWIKTKATADTPGYSIMLRPPEETPEDIADRIAGGFLGPKPPMQVGARFVATNHYLILVGNVGEFCPQFQAETAAGRPVKIVMVVINQLVCSCK